MLRARHLQTTWARVPTLPLLSCAISGKRLNLSGPRFLSVNWGDEGTCLGAPGWFKGEEQETRILHVEVIEIKLLTLPVLWESRGKASELGSGGWFEEACLGSVGWGTGPTMCWDGIGPIWVAPGSTKLIQQSDSVYLWIIIKIPASPAEKLVLSTGERPPGTLAKPIWHWWPLKEGQGWLALWAWLLPQGSAPQHLSGTWKEERCPSCSGHPEQASRPMWA